MLLTGEGNNYRSHKDICETCLQQGPRPCSKAILNPWGCACLGAEMPASMAVEQKPAENFQQLGFTTLFLEDCDFFKPNF